MPRGSWFAFALTLTPIDALVGAMPAVRISGSPLLGWSTKVARPGLVSHLQPGRAGGIVAMTGGANVLVANALGFVLSAGALSIYLPIITEIVKTKCVDGVSKPTWALQSLGFLIFVVYHIRMGYAVSTFLDFAVLLAQSATILILSCFFERKASPWLILPAIGLPAALLVTSAALQQMQLAATVITTVALVPQIWSNLKGKTRGGFSAISAGLAAGGNAARIFTTLTLAGGNLILLAQFAAGVVLNSVLLVQALIWE